MKWKFIVFLALVATTSFQAHAEAESSFYYLISNELKPQLSTYEYFTQIKHRSIYYTKKFEIFRYCSPAEDYQSIDCYAFDSEEPDVVYRIIADKGGRDGTESAAIFSEKISKRLPKERRLAFVYRCSTGCGNWYVPKYLYQVDAAPD